MANAAAGTVWNLPNYTGELFTADMINTPFLSMIGGLGGGKMTENFQFPVDTEYAHEALAQKSITETGSLTPPTAISYVRTQNTNVTQIFQEQVSISYVRMSNQGRLSGLNTAGANNPVVSEKDWQIAKALESVARQVEWHYLQGTYNLAAAANQANQTRGMISAAATTSAAGGAALTKAMIDALFLAMFGAGAMFQNVVAFMNGYQKQAISSLYGYAPEDRNVGGVNIKQIETDFGNIGISAAHRMMPVGTILFAEMSVVDAVFQPVPQKGNLFYEELARTGAAESGQIFGQVGLNHGPSFAHGTITGLKSA